METWLSLTARTSAPTEPFGLVSGLVGASTFISPGVQVFPTLSFLFLSLSLSLSLAVCHGLDGVTLP